MSEAEEFIEAARIFLAEESYEEALLLMSEAIDLDPANTDYLIERSQAYCDQRDYDSAIADCELALDIDSQCERAYSFRSFVYEITGEYDKAIDDTNMLLELVDRYPLDLYVYRAHLFTKKGDLTSALADYDFIIEWNPSHPKHHFQRGLVLMSLKLFERARPDFQYVIESMPEGHLMRKASEDYLIEMGES